VESGGGSFHLGAGARVQSGSYIYFFYFFFLDAGRVGA
jgi:hypothetical protein